MTCPTFFSPLLTMFNLEFETLSKFCIRCEIIKVVEYFLHVEQKL